MNSNLNMQLSVTFALHKREGTIQIQKSKSLQLSNSSNMKFLLSAIIISLISTFSFAQDYSLNKTEKDNYKIAKIEVVGALHTTPESVISLSGLKEGQVINLNGFAISNAITSLTASKLYDAIQIFEKDKADGKITLEINLLELPVLKSYSFKNLKDFQTEALDKLLEDHLQKGLAVTSTDKSLAKKAIEDHYKAKGYVDVEVLMGEVTWPSDPHLFEIVFEVIKNEKVRVAEIILNGNQLVPSEQLKKVMLSKDKTQILKPNVYVAENLEADKQALIAYYNTLGYRDAIITKERIKHQSNGDVKIYLQIEEGQQYFFRNISWEGNSKYDTTVLNRLLGIKKGDVFNEQLLYQQLNFSPDGQDVGSIYMDDGHLFFTAKAFEINLVDQSIDIMIIINEGEQLEIGEIKITGNNETSDAVIRRELKTLPGDKFNRDAVMRSQRALMNLGYFNPETLEAVPHPNEKTGLVDLEYKLEEKSNDMFNVAGSWGGPDVGLVGTTGIQLNNFSLKKALKLEGIKGDGQQLGLNAQFGGRRYQSINFNFAEPWLGQKKPNKLAFGSSYTNYRSQDPNDEGNFERLKILGVNVGFGQRIEFWNEDITANTSLHFQQYQMSDWSRGLFQTDQGELVSNGQYNNLSIKQSFTRNTLNHPLFPTKGSRISFSMQVTPPFNLIAGKSEPGETAQENYKWMEYHKWRLTAEKYIPVHKRYTLKLSGKVGFMGGYNKSFGVSPFERFQLGGDALSNSQIGFTGIDRITLRGYDVEDLENNLQNGEISATPIFNKFTAEFRVPVLKNPNASTYVLGFAEAGNSFRSIKDFNPLNLKKSFGIGFRTQLPMIGTLGVDYGIGIDKAGPRTLQNLGQFSFTLGFELD